MMIQIMRNMKPDRELSDCKITLEEKLFEFEKTEMGTTKC
jgi:hypothetical protein